MTQALNLGLLGNNVNASGQLSLTAGVTGTLPVANGGLGATSFAVNNLLLGNGGSTFQTLAPGAVNNVLVSNGAAWVSGGVPAPSTANVLSATAGAGGGDVGTYAWLHRPAVTGNVGGQLTIGQTVAGSIMRFAGQLGGNIVVSGTPSGTWRCMGFMAASFDSYTNVTSYGATLFLRIS